MKDFLINFKNMKWDYPAPGIRCKEYINGNQKIRLVEFSEQFSEENWCTKGHVGYVIEGKISINFDGRIVEFQSGEGLFITEGDATKHKGSVAQGRKALLILFEKA